MKPNLRSQHRARLAQTRTSAPSLRTRHYIYRLGMERDASSVTAEIAASLRQKADPERAQGAKAYLKSSLEHIGVRVPEIRSIANASLPRRSMPSRELILDVVDVLWAQPVHEYRLAACHVLVEHGSEMTLTDLNLVESMIRESKTWALVDVLAGDVTWQIVAAEPTSAVPVLDRWNCDADFWLRRASVLSLLRPLRAGGGNWPLFCRYADNLWEDKEFFVRKALGWVLRDTAKKRPDMVFEWLLPRAASASGVTIREAIKPLSAPQREAIAAQRSSPPSSSWPPAHPNSGNA